MFFVVIFAVTACNTTTKPVTTETDEAFTSSETKENAKIDENKPPVISPNGCIAPVETFAYPVSPETGMLPISNVLPSGSWQIDTSLLDESRYSQLLATRSLNGQLELWILAEPSSQQKTKENVYEFTIYYPNSKTWKTVPAEIGNSGIHIYKLFVAQDGSIFGLPYLDHPDKTLEISVLSKLNEKTGVFEFVRDAQAIPTSSASSDGFYSSSKVVLDAQGKIFWVLVPDDAIYSYNPITQESKKHITLPDIDMSHLAEAAFSPDGNIYYLSFEPNVFTNNNIWLYRFELATETVERIAIKLEPWPLTSTIFADHSGRLWFGAVGWLEPDRTWYQMLRSSIFITNVVWSGMEHRWKSPEILMESSDNRLWFKSDENGLVWLDPAKEEWCWFTTYRSNIVEDQLHNLWMIADGKLYKYPLRP